MGSDVILVLVVVTAICFDFTNGFHDTANAVATSIATGALKPRVAVLMSAVLNLVGAFLSIKVAATIAKGIVNPTVLGGNEGLALVFAALIGAVIWNLITWYFSLPSSSSHALIGGVIGATLVASGTGAISFHNLAQTVLAPAVLSPIICCAVAALGTFCAYRLIRLLGDKEAKRGYRYGQIGAGVVVAFGMVLLELQNAGKPERSGARVANYALVAVAALFCLGAVVLGIYAMTQKS